MRPWTAFNRRQLAKVLPALVYDVSWREARWSRTSASGLKLERHTLSDIVQQTIKHLDWSFSFFSLFLCLEGTSQHATITSFHAKSICNHLYFNLQRVINVKRSFSLIIWWPLDRRTRATAANLFNTFFISDSTETWLDIFWITKKYVLSIKCHLTAHICKICFCFSFLNTSTALFHFLTMRQMWNAI